MSLRGFLGIDAGTQGLSIIFTDENLKMLAAGEADYDMVTGLCEGCYEQHPDDWIAAMETAMARLRSAIGANQSQVEVLAIGVSGQMHGEVLADANGKALKPARLWCDSRNDQEGFELTEKFAVKMPKRITAARWLWTIRNDPEVAANVAHMTTPAGWIAYQLTGQWLLGIGDAAGMFPVDGQTQNYDARLLSKFDGIVAAENVAGKNVTPIGELLPTIRRAGEDGAALTKNAAAMLGLPEGVPVAPAEGDQPAALAGSLISAAGTVSMSFGTSVCCNSVGDRSFEGVNTAVDHFCAADGKPINMVCLRNGTTFMNSVAKMFCDDEKQRFGSVINLAVEADPDCGGILAMPFMDDEPALEVDCGGTAMLFGLNAENAKPGNVVKAALLATMFNLKLGCAALDEQGFPRTEIVLSGGLTKTPELGQVLADVFDVPVKLLNSAEEGTAWGATLMAKFRYQTMDGPSTDWTTFVSGYEAGDARIFTPDQDCVAAYADAYERYLRLLKSRKGLQQALTE